MTREQKHKSDANNWSDDKTGSLFIFIFLALHLTQTDNMRQFNSTVTEMIAAHVTLTDVLIMHAKIRVLRPLGVQVVPSNSFVR